MGIMVGNPSGRRMGKIKTPIMPRDHSNIYQIGEDHGHLRGETKYIKMAIIMETRDGKETITNMMTEEGMIIHIMYLCRTITTSSEGRMGEEEELQDSTKLGDHLIGISPMGEKLEMSPPGVF